MAGVALATAIVAAVPAGAVVAEGGVAVVRGQRRRPLAIAGGALVWAAIGTGLGAGPLGPLAPVATALRGSGSSLLALAVAGGVGVALALSWVELAATRVEPRARRPRRVGRLVPTGRLARSNGAGGAPGAEERRAPRGGRSGRLRRRRDRRRDRRGGAVAERLSARDDDGAPRCGSVPARPRRAPPRRQLALAGGPTRPARDRGCCRARRPGRVGPSGGPRRVALQPSSRASPGARSGS